MHQHPDPENPADWVFLATKTARWRKLPHDIQQGLLHKKSRLRAIRNEIASSSKVQIMPPIEITDVGWVTQDGLNCIHGRATIIYMGSSRLFGAELPAPTVLLSSDEALRGILLHEFSHCFRYMRLAVAHINSNEGGALSLAKPSDLLSDEDWDRQMLEKPEHWYCEDDCKIFPYQHSSLLAPATDEVAEKWIVRGLPVETPKMDFDIESFAIPSLIQDYIQALEADAKR